MFGSLAYAVVLMGCSDDMTGCRQMTRGNGSYTTLAECELAQDAALMSDVAAQIEYPTVAAKCVRAASTFADKGSTSQQFASLKGGS